MNTIPSVPAEIDPQKPPRSLYVHIPFCFHKCHYCDFYSLVDTHDRQARFIQRLISELKAASPLAADPISTLFVGGGTPTLLRVELWHELLSELHNNLSLTVETEFTVEANPETVTGELARVLATGGVNRISIGAQSFNPTHLETLERWHDPANVAQAVGLVRRAGINDVNLDLIFGIPGQTLGEWTSDLELALALEPDHLSCYGLTYEPNTAMTARLRAGDFNRINEQLEAEMFQLTRDRLSAAGFAAYEISNFARPGAECRHNLAYWNDQDWLALGPSASGHIGAHRWKNVPHLGTYLSSPPGPAPIVEHEVLTPSTRLAERIMLGLRLADGLDRADLIARADELGIADRLNAALQSWIDSGHLVESPQRYRLSDAGLLLADTVIAELMACTDPR